MAECGHPSGPSAWSAQAVRPGGRGRRRKVTRNGCATPGVERGTGGVPHEGQDPRRRRARLPPPSSSSTGPFFGGGISEIHLAASMRSTAAHARSGVVATWQPESAPTQARREHVASERRPGQGRRSRLAHASAPLTRASTRRPSQAGWVNIPPPGGSALSRRRRPFDCALATARAALRANGEDKPQVAEPTGGGKAVRAMAGAGACAPSTSPSSPWPRSVLRRRKSQVVPRPARTARLSNSE